MKATFIAEGVDGSVVFLNKEIPVGAHEAERLDGLGAGFALPSDVRTESVQAGGVAAEWTETPGAEPGRVILFLHGGGYVSGSIKSHRHMIAEAGRQAKARTLALGYGLARLGTADASERTDLPRAGVPGRVPGRGRDTAVIARAARGRGGPRCGGWPAG